MNIEILQYNARQYFYPTDSLEHSLYSSVSHSLTQKINFTLDKLCIGQANIVSLRQTLRSEPDPINHYNYLFMFYETILNLENPLSILYIPQTALDVGPVSLPDWLLQLQQQWPPVGQDCQDNHQPMVL